MESVIRALVIYAILLVATRLAGRRTLSESTPFDLVLLLVVAESLQQALLGDDHSITNSAVLLATLFLTDVALSYVKRVSRGVELALEGMPTVLMSEGKLDVEALETSRLELSEILEAARKRGLKSLSEIDSAILEVDGSISIIPVRRLKRTVTETPPLRKDEEGSI